MIYLYDASAIICSGTLTKQKLRYGKRGSRGDLNYYSFPTAGTYSLMSYIASDLRNMKKGDKIVVAFDCSMKSNIRKLYFPDYKLNRLKNQDVRDNYGGSIPDSLSLEELTSDIRNLGKITDYELKERVRDIVKSKSIGLQKQLTMWMLEQMGINVLYHENLEADDLIYSVCYKYGSEDILLRADDSDLHDCKLYAPKLKMRSVAGRGEIDLMTGRMFGKIVYGDMKDNIFPLSDNISRDKLKGLANTLSKGIQDVNTLIDPRKLSYMGFNEEEIYFITKNAFLKIPKIIDVNVENTELLEEETSRMMSIFGFKSLLKRLNLERYVGRDMKIIHNNIYSSLPRYVKEWHSLVEFKEKKEDIDNHMAEVMAKSDDTAIKNLDEILKLI